MLKHADIWRAIDLLAVKHDMSASGLAQHSGLDPTTFNKSKRITKKGKQRWPSTETIAKILSATGDSLAEFIAQMGKDNAAVLALRIPVISFAQAGDESYFDYAGYPTGKAWDEVLLPQIADPYVFALEVGGDSMAPVYCDGDTIIVSPNADIRRGDRVVVRTRDGEVMAKKMARQSARRVELVSLTKPRRSRMLDAENIAWIARIVSTGQ
jgi:phage repressor protein C with HTH and peptisase S24 domain